MTLRAPVARLSRRCTPSQITSLAARNTAPSWNQHKAMATVVPPVTQDAVGSKGPTGIMFMNMGGPQTTDQVGTFLSRLFVCRNVSFLQDFVVHFFILVLTFPRLTAT